MPNGLAHRLVMMPTRHRKVRGVHRPRMPVRFEAGNHWRRKRRVGEGADCDPDDVRRNGDIPVHGRTALRAEVIRGAPAIAGAKRDRLPALAGKRPRRRLAFYRHLLPGNSRLHAEHAARPLLALVALAQGYALWVGPFVRNAELPAIARSLMGGHFSSCSLRPRSVAFLTTMKGGRAGPRHADGMNGLSVCAADALPPSPGGPGAGPGRRPRG